eukprot:12687237-Heterocapsa_arctica.AAC.1
MAVHGSTLVALTVPGRPEMICLALGEGDRQCDGPAAQKFALTYDKCVEEMMKASRALLDETHLTYVEPIARLTANIDNVRYADDLASIG